MIFSSLPKPLKIVLLVVLLFLVNSWVFLVWPDDNVTVKQEFQYVTKNVEVTYKDGSKKVFKAEVADTDEKQNQGLSFREKLDADKAMVFPMNPAQKSISFYMKDMRFPIDIYYIDRTGKVVQTMRNLEPCPEKPLTCPDYDNTSGVEVANVLEVVPQEKEIVSVQ